jgi:Flp pilus assembly protein CpaB
METHTVIVLFALVAAFGLVTVVAVDVILTIQEVDADPRPTRGCNNSQAANASLGRCIK